MIEDTPKARILMVDDEDEFLEASSQALERRCFEVHIARDGGSALMMIERQDFEAVVLDVKMPGIDGIEVFHQIKKIHPNLPVIILTGHGSISQAFETSREGIADYLAKPIDINVLAARIKQVIEQSRERLRAVDDYGSGAESLDLIHLLIIDDETELTDSLKRIFERRNMEVYTAASGQEGLGILEEKPVDVVILDIKMPGMDGMEVLELIKRDYPNVQVIILTGHPSVETALKGVKLGASEYLTKPAEAEEFVSTVRRVYDKRRENLEKLQKELAEDIRRRYPD
ncbi:MAG: response regulator [Candidatus Zixiibacteriota bacterium]|nr:MAG: response regulator [candidate division Zixibacteria bacterium]